MTEPLYLTTAAVIRETGVCKRTWERLREHGGGPPYVRIGSKVFYHRAPFNEWMASRTFRHRAAEAVNTTAA